MAKTKYKRTHFYSIVSMLTDEEASWEVMQEFIHDRHAMEWIDD